VLRWEHRRWAVEGCHGAGRSLAQRLVADGELVLDVAAKLAARVRVYPGGHGRETEKDDAVSIGLAALDGAGIMAVRPDDALVSLRLQCDRREELTAARTQAVCRLHRLLAELTPGGMRRELCASKTQALLAGIRPGDEVGKVRMEMARDHLAGIRALDARLKAIEAEIAALVTTLTSMYGIGPVIAGRILAETGDISRFATKDKFASYNGTAPIDASSGDQVRHRLSRSGNRRMNHALRRVAVSQIRNRGSAGRLCYERRRQEGTTPKEALRCLKRRRSDLARYQLLADAKGTIRECGSPTTRQRKRSRSSSPVTRSRLAAPPSRHPTRPAPTDSSPSTGKTAASPASRSSTRPVVFTMTISRTPKSSANRKAM